MAPTIMIADVDDGFETGAKAGKTAGELLVRLQAGGVRALARAISCVEEHAPEAAELLAACRASGRRALRVGVTGPPGAGKSTLVDQLIRRFRGQGKTVGVIAVDPSSPYSGGALLGDRIRMAGFAGDEGVYIRSMASRGAGGGLAAAAVDVCTVMEAAGRDVLLIETVGAGQSEVDVAKLADVTLVVLVPGMGDEVQSLKAGMMEIAGIFVVNKADCAGAENLEAEVLAMQRLGGPGGGVPVPVVKTVATTGEGIADLMQMIETAAAASTRRSPLPSRALHEELQVKENGARLDHLGIAVRSIAAARGFYESLGLSASAEETVEQEQVKTLMLRLGETRLELLEATAEDSTIGRFVAKRGEGLHHIAIRIGDIDAVFARMETEGVRLASESIRCGAGGHRYFFVHPASAGGVLVEIVGDAQATSHESVPPIAEAAARS
ncbi:MAG TPA: methylmalonyl Co-A mutase-associated GTPase MeaB [Acidobacteriaceae bacterium]|nr:methylmalonyl Co-A mutase-associated GTPase MeaB [Acidobacteriaceae bacterium]